MGIFDGFDFKRKSDAYAILQRYFAKFGSLYGVNLTNKKDIVDLVESACRDTPQLLSSKLHRVALSSSIIVYAMDNCLRNGNNETAKFFHHCLGQILIDIESGSGEFQLSSNDINTINGCANLYKEYAEQLDDGIDLANT